MRIFITGADGQTGRALRRLLPPGSVVAPARSALDVTDRGAVTDAIRGVAPDAVIHAAALTDTMRCEREPALAYAVNALGTANVAAATARAGARLVAVSTNEVFAGDQSEPYTEDAQAHPLSEYATSKLEGERRARSACPDTLIARTSWLYGEGEGNFVAKVLAAARESRPLRFVTDEIATPTRADDLAAAIVALLDAQAPAGVYHLTSEGAATRYDWAQAILSEAGMDPGRIEAVTTAELRGAGYEGPHKPPYSVLANTRAAALGVRLPPWREALAAHFQRIQAADDA